MDKVILDAWECRRVWEDDDAYEDHISLGPPNDVAAAYEREVQRAAVAVRPSSRRRSGSFDGQHIPPAVPPRCCHTEGGEGLSAAAATTSGVSGLTRGGREGRRGGERTGVGGDEGDGRGGGWWTRRS
jgi:hypothetical protein